MAPSAASVNENGAIGYSDHAGAVEFVALHCNNAEHLFHEQRHCGK
jgi:hypothetical protein